MSKALHYLCVSLLVLLMVDIVQCSDCRSCNENELEYFKKELERNCKSRGMHLLFNRQCCKGTCGRLKDASCGGEIYFRKYCGPGLHCEYTIKRRRLQAYLDGTCIAGYELLNELSNCSQMLNVNKKIFCEGIAQDLKADFISSPVDASSNDGASCWMLSNGKVKFTTKPDGNTTEKFTPICFKKMIKSKTDSFHWPGTARVFG